MILPISVVIPVKDQLSRLTLTLTALKQQENVHRDFEVIVVDDASTTSVAQHLRERSYPYPLQVLTCQSGGARGLTRNIGAASAKGEVVLFLDADACPGAQLLAKHRAAQRSEPGIVLGDCHVVRGTEALEDPISGRRFPNATADSTVPPLVIPPDELLTRGDALLRRHACKGIYPGQTRHLQGLEDMAARRSPLAWAAAIPHNLSIQSKLFRQLQGFDTKLPHFEGWDLGLRAHRLGVRPRVARGADTFHLHHLRSLLRQHRAEEQAWEVLRMRYPGEGVEAIALWSLAMAGDRYSLAELNLANAKVVESMVANRAGILLLKQLWERRPLKLSSPMEEWLSGMNGALYGAIAE